MVLSFVRAPNLQGCFMKETPAIYQGRIVSKNNFRAYIYASDGSQKLVESWDEYERHMETGLWFSLKEDAINRIPVKKKKISSVKNIETKEPIGILGELGIEQELPQNKLGFEIKNDDFLPKTVSK